MISTYPCDPPADKPRKRSHGSVSNDMYVCIYMIIYLEAPNHARTLSGEPVDAARGPPLAR